MFRPEALAHQQSGQHGSVLALRLPGLPVLWACGLVMAAALLGFGVCVHVDRSEPVHDHPLPAGLAGGASAPVQAGRAIEADVRTERISVLEWLLARRRPLAPRS